MDYHQNYAATLLLAFPRMPTYFQYSDLCGHTHFYVSSTSYLANQNLPISNSQSKLECNRLLLLAKIEYIKTPNGEIYLTHTEVPRALGGKGIGSQLVEKTLKDIEQKDLRLVPLCPFVAGYIHKHPEWRRIVMKGFHIQ